MIMYGLLVFRYDVTDVKCNSYSNLCAPDTSDATNGIFRSIWTVFEHEKDFSIDFVQ